MVWPKSRKSKDMLEFLEQQGLYGGVSHQGRRVYRWCLLKIIERREFPDSDKTETIAEGHENHPQSAWTQIKNAYEKYIASQSESPEIKPIEIEKGELLELISSKLSTSELRQHSLRRIHKELRRDEITVEQALQRLDHVGD